MKSRKEDNEYISLKTKMPSGVEDLMKAYERFQKAYAATEQYLEIISPKTHQSNSNQSFVGENS